MGSLHQFGRPQLPAFCRTRAATERTTVVRARSLRHLQQLMLLTLMLQFCTLVLVLAGPVSTRPAPPLPQLAPLARALPPTIAGPER
mgnify:CR=1 FL=1